MDKEKMKKKLNDCEKLIEELEGWCLVDDYYADDEYICIHIDFGDWKHAHLRADHIMEGLGYELRNENVTEEDGSDAYSAWRLYGEKNEQKNCSEVISDNENK